MSVPLGILSDIEGKLRALRARDLVLVAQMLTAYRRGELGGDEFARWVEVNLDPDRMVARAGIGSRSSAPPAAA
jgi:hypothetical protein